MVFLHTDQVEGKVQKIKDNTGGKVLGFKGVPGTVTEGTKVNLEVKHTASNMPVDSNQHWIFNRIDNDPNGFFTITSETSQMLLHGNSEGDAFVGYEHYKPPLDYKNEPKSKSITSRKSTAQCKTFTENWASKQSFFVGFNIDKGLKNIFWGNKSFFVFQDRKLKLSASV